VAPRVCPHMDLVPLVISVICKHVNGGALSEARYARHADEVSSGTKLENKLGGLNKSAKST